VNTELVRLYWRIGSTILQRQDQEGWGTNVIGRLADDLRAEFPEMTGFSSRNLFYMRAFAAAWADGEVVQQAVADLPWGHITVLLNRLDDQETHNWGSFGGNPTFAAVANVNAALVGVEGFGGSRMDIDSFVIPPAAPN
jgi:hypothetical protein